MSLGFLTESALLPSKAKQIRVDSKSLLDLKAVVFQKEQERDERRRRLRGEARGDGDDAPRSTRRKRAGGADGEGDDMSKSVYARLKAQKRRRASDGGDKDANRGVDERRRRDDEQRALDVDNSDDDAALQKKSREMLARKAQLYDEMMRNSGAVPAEAAKECLVDFGAKRRAGEWHTSVAESEGTKDGDREMVEITDEFGRTRVVEKGSVEHVEFVQREGATRQGPESLFFEDKRRDASEAAPAHANGGSFVVSQWEKTLTGTEKQYLEQVHAGVERAKQTSSSAMTDKQRRKQLRLEKLKQQQQQQQPSPTTAQAAVDLQQDQQAAVQATAFLSSFM